MNCIFCPDSPIGIPTYKKTWRICTKCATRYMFSHGEIAAYAISAKYKDQYYIGEFRLAAPVIGFSLLEEDTTAVGMRVNDWSGKEIMKLDYLPKISLDGFAEKIPTLITFS